MSAPVDVLAVMDGDIEGMESVLSQARGKQREDLIAAIEQMREAREAVAELIKKAQDNAAGGCPCDGCEGLRVAIRNCGGEA